MLLQMCGAVTSFKHGKGSGYMLLVLVLPQDLHYGVALAA
jgi:hypothetical protein